MSEGGTEPEHPGSVCPCSVSMSVHAQYQELNSRGQGEELTPPQQVREVVSERGRMRGHLAGLAWKYTEWHIGTR